VRTYAQRQCANYETPHPVPQMHPTLITRIITDHGEGGNHLGPGATVEGGRLEAGERRVHPPDGRVRHRLDRTPRPPQRHRPQAPRGLRGLSRSVRTLTQSSRSGCTCIRVGGIKK